jgi:hypothetical protein
MKKFILMFVLVIIYNCDNKSDNDINNILKPLEINYYAPKTFDSQIEEPQLTIRNETIQITAIGSNNSASHGPITKIYFSDATSQTEWIVLINDSGSPEFMYGLNIKSKEKLPYLYEVEKINSSSHYLRYYNYDWVNRLGTLLYETKITGDEVEVIFNNQIDSNKSIQGKTNKSFLAPVIQLEKYFEKRVYKTKPFQKPTNELDEFFDLKLGEFVSDLKEFKSQLINAGCKTNEILNKSDRGFICKISDAIDDVVDVKIFKDLEELTGTELSEDTEEYNGSAFDINLSFFDDININSSNITDHFNDIRGNIREGIIDGISSIKDYLNDLNSLSDEEVDLNDLPDSNGVIQIGLSWNSDADIDLHVIDPFGEEIFFDNPNSNSGGYLDRDDIDGFGPENIYWSTNIPSGKYSISLVYYSPDDGPFTDCVVKVINGLGVSETFEVGLGYFNSNKVGVVDFIFEEETNNIVFQ